MMQRLLYGGFMCFILLGSCVKQPVSENNVGHSPSVKQGMNGEDSFFDSLRAHSSFTDSRFASLQKEDSIRWRLVTDLLNYYYSLKWAEESVHGEIDPDDRIVERRLAAAPAYWTLSQGASTDQKYAALLKQCEKLSDFPADNEEEENCKGGLKRFLERYLALQCARKLDETPKTASLTRALDEEQAAWRNYLRAETFFSEELNKISNPDRYSALGMKKGEFLDARRKRREEADRMTYFALTSASYQPPYTDYVTWAETQQEYAALQGRLYPNGTNTLKTALAKESAAWFAFAKSRTAVEDLLSGPGKQIYMAGTRMLKKYHLNDLKAW